MTDRVRLVRAGVIAAVLAVSAAGCGSSAGGSSPAAKERLKIEWVTTNDKPGCSYDAPTRTITAQLSIDGFAPKKRTATLVVTAYADENTSQPVGSKSTFVKLGGTVHQLVTVVFEVAEPPQVGEDGVAACKRELKD